MYNLEKVVHEKIKNINKLILRPMLCEEKPLRLFIYHSGVVLKHYYKIHFSKRDTSSPF